MGIIYCATNKLNGKKYIGRTSRTLKRRITEHLGNKSTTGFSGAIKKYGAENFEWEILEEVPNEMLREREIFYIKHFNAFSENSELSNGYNLTPGGDGAPFGSMNPFARPEIAKRIAEKNRGRKLSEEHREKLSEALTGKIRTIESIQNGIETTKKNRKLGLHKPKTGANNPKSKTWIVYFPNGEKLVITGLREFCRQHSLNEKLMRRTARDEQENHKGFILEFYSASNHEPNKSGQS